MIEQIRFIPPRGLSSAHLQTTLTIFNKGGKVPPSDDFLVLLEEEDKLCCKISTPSCWNPSADTIVLIHGLGGSEMSSYMIRMTRKLFVRGFRVVRINLRNCGSGEGMSRRPYHGGTSNDLRRVIEALKKQTPHSPITLIGYSLGGNIALKLAGELEEKNKELINHVIALCPPLDLSQSLELIFRPSNRFYHHYYVRCLKKQVTQWMDDAKKITSILDIDNQITAPLWGFKDAFDYYKKCSCLSFLTSIHLPCHILFAEDDPFIDYRPILKTELPSCVQVGISKYGGHLGFFGWSDWHHGYYWLDRLVFDWI